MAASRLLFTKFGGSMQRFIYFYSQKEKAIMKSFYYSPASLLALIVLFSACRKNSQCTTGAKLLAR
jgi:hypothetical protein